MRIVDFIIAEDIRFETGNKFSIMGIYNSEIGVDHPDNTQWPIPFRFGIYIRVEVSESDKYPNRFTLRISHDNYLDAQADGSIEFIKWGPAISIPLVISPFPLSGYGLYQFNFEIYKDESLLISETRELNIHSQ